MRAAPAAPTAPNGRATKARPRRPRALLELIEEFRSTAAGIAASPFNAPVSCLHWVDEPARRVRGTPPSRTAAWWDRSDPDARAGADVLGLRGDDSIRAGSELEARLTAFVGAQGMAAEANAGAANGFAGVGYGHGDEACFVRCFDAEAGPHLSVEERDRRSLGGARDDVDPVVLTVDSELVEALLRGRQRRRDDRAPAVRASVRAA